MNTHRYQLTTAVLVALASVFTVTSCAMFEKNPVAVKFDSAGDSTAIIARSPASPNRLSSEPHQAVVLESYRSLDPCNCGGSSKSLNGSLVGDWNYITDSWDNLGGWNWIKSKYGSNLSTYSSAYSNPGAYGLMGGYGRGFQCKAFANYITYRSGVYQAVLPSYAAGNDDYVSGRRSFTRPISQVRIGDVIQTFATNGHTAIVVRIISGVEGQSVSAAEVVDSNFIGSEVIGKHVLYSSGSGVNNLKNYYALRLY